MSRPKVTGYDRHGNLAAVFAGGSVVGCTDAELLDRFGAGADAELAFAALVERHGPLVWGVCRRVLADRTDAEDAFQATFLVLVRKAGSVRVDDSLGRWLYGVSRRVAARTRADRDRRRRRESVGMVPDRAGPDALGLHQVETFAALDAEVARLPEPFRAAVVLCDLGGLTLEQAALDLNCPVGTIKSRLARGRARLRDRLVRRGFDGASVVSMVRLAHPSADLIGATVRSAVAGTVPTLASVVVPGFFAFKDGVAPMILTFRLPWLVGFTALATAGVTGWTWFAGDDGPGDPVVQDAAPAAPARLKIKDAPVPRTDVKVSLPEYIVEPPDILAVEVREALPDRPISGERLVRPDGKLSLGFYGELYVAGLTTTQIKEQVVLHLRQYITDRVLGLEQRKEDGTTVKVAPTNTTKVFVDVVKYNSKVYYVQGDVGTPGRLPITGNETVLDAITYAGGLIPTAKKATNIRLVRPAPRGECCEQVLPVDFKAIVEQADTKTNYQLRPGDRIMVYRDPPGPAASKLQDDRPTTTTATRDGAGPGSTLNPGQEGEVTPTPDTSKIAREFAMQSLPEYVVEPPDMIKVEVLNALPGQPIKGERLVQPDGRITLGYYGQVYVAGLTLNEIKAKVTLHLRGFLTDAQLGLSQDQDGKLIAADLGKTTRVAVEMSRYNSKVYYVQGKVGSPGRLNITGNDTVLDAIQYAGGLTYSKNPRLIRLARPAPPGAAGGLILPVDLAAILDRGDARTNYQMLPGDRLIVGDDPTAPPAAPRVDPEEEAMTRLREVERKLDLILQKLEDKDKP